MTSELSAIKRISESRENSYDGREPFARAPQQITNSERTATRFAMFPPRRALALAASFVAGVGVAFLALRAPHEAPHTQAHVVALAAKKQSTR